jgi:hypothetical protein
MIKVKEATRERFKINKEYQSLLFLEEFSGGFL